MGIRSFVASIWAKKLVKKYRKSHLNAFESQDFWMKSNVKMAEKTLQKIDIFISSPGDVVEERLPPPDPVFGG